MPPRFTYWTIIFGGQPTSFRSATRDELLPTFKQIQSKHADAQLRYFARGKLWYSEEEAHAALVRDRFEKRQRPRPAGRWRPGSAPKGASAEPPRARPPRPGATAAKPTAGRWQPKPGGRPPEAGGGKAGPRGWKPPTGRWKPKAGSRSAGPNDRRGPDWRPGGDHQDARARFKVPRDVKRARMAKKFGWKKNDEE
jgi:hypothetical protein